MTFLTLLKKFDNGFKSAIYCFILQDIIKYNHIYFLVFLTFLVTKNVTSYKASLN